MKSSFENKLTGAGGTYSSIRLQLYRRQVCTMTAATNNLRLGVYVHRKNRLPVWTERSSARHASRREEQKLGPEPTIVTAVDPGRLRSASPRSMSVSQLPASGSGKRRQTSWALVGVGPRPTARAGGKDDPGMHPSIAGIGFASGPPVLDSEDSRATRCYREHSKCGVTEGYLRSGRGR